MMACFMLLSASPGAPQEQPLFLDSQSSIKTGGFRVSFKVHSPLANLHALANRMDIALGLARYPDYYYNLKDETFEIYVPENYDPKTSYGLIVNISPSDSGGLPWPDLPPDLEKRKLIWIGANNSGNQQNVHTRRIPLALDAAYNMMKICKINPHRVYLSGISGGGRVSSMAAFHYSDVFSGGIFMIGVNYWAAMPIPSKPDRAWPKGFNKPDVKYLSQACNTGRYVFLTGDNDGNREQTYEYYMKGYKKCLKYALYLQVPKMGHERPPLDWYEKALDFLDNPQTEKEK
ncbi:MAG: hypothetical protein AB1656_07985 [Candidatus Omnitrophota bacterium]